MATRADWPPGGSCASSDGYLPVQDDLEVQGVHVLAVHLEGGGEQVEFVAHRLEEVVGILGVVGAEPPLRMGPDLGRGDELLRLADVVGAPDAKELRLDDVIGPVRSRTPAS